MSKGSRGRRKQERKRESTAPAIAETTAREERSSIRLAVVVPPAPAAHHEEDDFFARGEEEVSVPPASFDTEIAESDPEPVQSHPYFVERRARFRRIVTGVVGAAAALTIGVAARALVIHARPR